jgi:hypothetical protein
VDAPLDATRLVETLRDDPRVQGLVRLAATDGRTRLVVATTWDGRGAVAARLPELAGHVVDTVDAATLHEGPRLDLLTPTGERLELRAVRIGDLKPSAEGEGGEPLLDPKGLLAQWVEWSHGRPRTEPDADVLEREGARRVLGIDDGLRSLVQLAPGSTVLHADGTAAPIRHAAATHLRARAGRLPAGAAAEAVHARIAEALRAMPHAAAGLRVSGPGARERFLSVADAEGFAGDRVLLDAAETHVRAALGREPVFEVGFALATFDQVEARYALGEAVGGCQPPLVPGLLVGVAVTPADELALWSAPTVREPTGAAACVADDGTRAVVARTAGKDALLGALTDAVDGALDTLPTFLRRARGAHLEHVDDPEALLRPLHLPRSHVLAGGAHGALTPGTTRLLAALALARAATDMEPVVARKLELAAGRLLLGAAEAEEDCSTAS